MSKGNNRPNDDTNPLHSSRETKAGRQLTLPDEKTREIVEAGDVDIGTLVWIADDNGKHAEIIAVASESGELQKLIIMADKQFVSSRRRKIAGGGARSGFIG